jgi:hypothetical protein
VTSAAPFRSLILLIASWIGRRQGEAIEYLRAESRVLRARLGHKRLRFGDSERRLLAQNGCARSPPTLPTSPRRHFPREGQPRSSSLRWRSVPGTTIIGLCHAGVRLYARSTRENEPISLATPNGSSFGRDGIVDIGVEPSRELHRDGPRLGEETAIDECGERPHPRERAQGRAREATSQAGRQWVRRRASSLRSGAIARAFRQRQDEVALDVLKDLVPGLHEGAGNHRPISRASPVGSAVPVRLEVTQVRVHQGAVP